MMILMSIAKREDLIEMIKKFINDPGHCHALRDWQRILSYCDWGLNTYPLLQPTLQSSYAKIRGKKIPLAPICLNKQVTRDLSWFAHHVSISSRVHFIEAQGWEEVDADLTLLSDVSQTGLTFWTPDLNVAFVSAIEESDIHYSNTFFNKTLAVILVIKWVANLPDCPQ